MRANLRIWTRLRLTSEKNIRTQCYCLQQLSALHLWDLHYYYWVYPTDVVVISCSLSLGKDGVVIPLCKNLTQCPSFTICSFILSFFPMQLKKKTFVAWWVFVIIAQGDCLAINLPVVGFLTITEQTTNSFIFLLSQEWSVLQRGWIYSLSGLSVS